ncbi:MAG: hypothetical protein M3R00_09265 [Pseudomonadota bacterium]|nr:hypothetical protein [Pseudomonadota bacterium]
MNKQSDLEWIQSNLNTVFTAETAARAAAAGYTRSQLILLGNEMHPLRSNDNSELLDHTLERLNRQYGSPEAFFLIKEFEKKGVTLQKEEASELLQIDPHNFTDDVRQMLINRIHQKGTSQAAIISVFSSLSQKHDMVEVAALIANGTTKSMKEAAQLVGENNDEIIEKEFGRKDDPQIISRIMTQARTIIHSPKEEQRDPLLLCAAQILLAKNFEPDWKYIEVAIALEYIDEVSKGNTMSSDKLDVLKEVMQKTSPVKESTSSESQPESPVIQKEAPPEAKAPVASSPEAHASASAANRAAWTRSNQKPTAAIHAVSQHRVERNNDIDALIKHYSEGNKLSRNNIHTLTSILAQPGIGDALNRPAKIAESNMSCGDYLKKALDDTKLFLVSSKEIKGLIANIDTQMNTAKAAAEPQQPKGNSNY